MSYIVIEGPDGSGKSEVTKRVAEMFREKDINVLLTREPGGTPYAEELRELILKSKSASGTPAMAFSLMFAANTFMNLRAHRGYDLVLSDRWAPVSSRAYQVTAADSSAERSEIEFFWDWFVKSLQRHSQANLIALPSLIVYLRTSPEVAHARRSQDQNYDNMDDGSKAAAAARIRLYDDLLLKPAYPIPSITVQTDHLTLSEVVARVYSHVVAVFHTESKAPSSLNHTEL